MFEIGGSLREARLKRNLTPAEVQKAIRIRDRYLQALEEERWELLPGDAYVKGFLRPLIVVAVIVAIVAGLAALQLSGSSGNKQGTPPPTSVATTTGSHHTTPRKTHKEKHTSAALPSHAILKASRADCWLWVRSGGASGTTVYEATLLQGKTLPVNLKKGPVWIEFGNPSALDVRLGGKLVAGLPSQPGDTVLLTRRGVRPA